MAKNQNNTNKFDILDIALLAVGVIGATLYCIGVFVTKGDENLGLVLGLAAAVLIVFSGFVGLVRIVKFAGI